MSTPNLKTENLPDWKLWFFRESLKYQRWFVYLLIIIITNISMILYFVLGRKNSFGWLLAIPLVFLVINEIAYGVRKKDVEKLLNASIDLTETKVITVNSIKGKEINKDYCYNYMKACGERIKLGHRYQITYLKDTMGKYIINWTDLDKEENKAKKKEIIKEKEVTISEPVKEEIEETETKLDLEETRRELEKRGLDIEEIKREIYNRNSSLDTELNLDINNIVNRGVKKDEN